MNFFKKHKQFLSDLGLALLAMLFVIGCLILLYWS